MTQKKYLRGVWFSHLHHSIFNFHHSLLKICEPTSGFLVWLNFYFQFSSLNTQKSENEWWDMKTSFLSFHILENWFKWQNRNNTHKRGPICDELSHQVRWYLLLQGPQRLFAASSFFSFFFWGIGYLLLYSRERYYGRLTKHRVILCFLQIKN